MFDIKTNINYQKALQDLRVELQASKDQPETKKMVTFLAGLVNVAKDHIFDSDQRAASAYKSMVKSMDIINQVVKELINNNDLPSSRCSQIYTEIRTDLTNIAIAISKSDYPTKIDKLRKIYSQLEDTPLKQSIYFKFQECLLAAKDNIEKFNISPILLLSLPNTIKDAFEEICMEISYCHSEFSDARNDFFNKIITDIKEIIQPKYNVNNLHAEYYKIFLNLSPILKLNNEAIEDFHELINSKSITIDIFKQEVFKILKINRINIEELEKELKVKKYKTLNKLLVQIIKHKSNQEEGLATCWNKSEDFFKEKILYLTDPKTSESYSGMIIESKKNPQGDWFFLLDNHSEITVTSNYNITFSQCHQYDFLTAILNGILTKNDTFQLMLSYDQQIESRMNADSYQISEIEQKKSKWGRLGNDYDDIHLTSSNKKLKYIISIRTETIDNKFIAKSIKIKEFKDEKSSALGETIEPHIFNSTYTIMKKSHQNILGIDKMNADENILIKEDKDPNRIKIRHLKKIKEKLAYICSQFLQSKNHEIANLLIDDLMNNKFTKISDQKMKYFKDTQPELATLVQKILKKCNDNFKIQHACEWILRQLIEEVNYASLVNQEKGAVISRTMDDNQETLEEFELKRIERRNNIWEELRFMYGSNQIDFIDIEDAFTKDVLLEKSTTAAQQQVDKKRYVNSMQEKDMQAKFGKCIEMSACTWNNYILTPYLITLPQIIDELDKKLSAEMKQIDNFNRNRAEREDKISKMKDEEKKLQNFIKDLKKLEINSQTSNIAKEINAKIAPLLDLKLNGIKSDIQSVEKDIKNKNIELIKIEIEITYLQKNIEQIAQDIPQTEKEIHLLSSQLVSPILLESSYQSDINRNQATILSKRRDLKYLEEEKMRYEISLNGIKDIPGRNKERDLCSKEIQQLNQKKLDLNIKITKASNRAFIDFVEELIKAKQLELENNIETRVFEEDFSAIDANIYIINKNIKEIQEQITLKQKKKRNFAIIIKRQEETLKRLRKFCTLVIQSNTRKKENDNGIISCLKFQEFYDQRRSEWEAELKNDLNFA